MIERNKIKEIRREKGLRQKDLSSMVGIFQSELSDIEMGKRKPNVYLAIKIAKALGKKVEDIFFYEEKEENNI